MTNCQQKLIGIKFSFVLSKFYQEKTKKDFSNSKFVAEILKTGRLQTGDRTL